MAERKKKKKKRPGPEGHEQPLTSGKGEKGVVIETKEAPVRLRGSPKAERRNATRSMPSRCGCQTQANVNSTIQTKTISSVGAGRTK